MRARRSHRVVRLARHERRVHGALALAPEPVARASPRPGPVEADLARVAESTVRLVVEVLAGTRTPRQLARRTVPEIYHGLAVHRVPVNAGTRFTPPRVLRTWLQEPSEGAAETGAVVIVRGGVHALALRLETHRGTWRCAALETTLPLHQ
jgi:Family of unknown function (DUF6459)